MNRMATGIVPGGRSASRFAAGVLLGALCSFSATATAQVEVAQQPLYLGSDVPGNLLLVPSVEFPTIISKANIGAFSRTTLYTGYFDSFKCYGYSFSEVETERHFYPSSVVTLGGSCAGALWHGNYLNWAATQTIDPFRKALTGGYRVRDTVSETWLEKARHDRDGAGWYARGQVGADLAAALSPFNNLQLNNRIDGLGNKMWFRSNTSWGSSPVPYNPAVHLTPLANTTYEVSVRVKVCDAAAGVEPNCVRYGNNWKPEGLIQEYSDSIRYGVFGYLNDHAMLRDGGVLRARMKFVGPQRYVPGEDPSTNANREWDPSTGVFVRNPDPADASATNAPIADSGVINYINKFGQMTSKNHKDFDPVSELYYAALRYLRNVGNVAAYTDLVGTEEERRQLADGFPVITSWEDPFIVENAQGEDLNLYCASNAILGIGDANTHRDKNLPGSTRSNDEPGMPLAVSQDDWVDVMTATAKVAELEGITINLPFTGRENSAFIAGLAYHAHTSDLRPEITDSKQTVATHWVDVREAETLEPRARNQYWLAAKYGGFRVPENFDPYARTTPLPAEWWHTTGDMLGTNYPRADNFYVAGEAGPMVESLTRAFANIIEDVGGSGASFAANSTRLEAGVRTFQAQFYSGSWYGDLKSFDIDEGTGALSEEAVASASDELAIQSAGNGWQQRNIWFHTGTGNYNNQRHLQLRHSNLTGTQQGVLNQQMVNYLRGERVNEQPNGSLRERRGLLGDIVHSEPVFVGRPNPALYMNSTFNGAANYAQFATGNDQLTRRQMIYVGANDGMLHAFDAETMRERYAFLPRAAINANLASFTQPGYEHRYFVDGETTVADVYYGNRWRTVLVGTMGRGGRSVFALDVTDPDDIEFLWEVTSAEVPALGNNLGKPIIAQVANGDWRVLLGNGPNGNNNRAQLLSLSIENGQTANATNYRVIDTGVNGTGGLSAVQTWDSTGDGFMDTAYAGDFAGNMWRFSALGTTNPTSSRLFTARADGTGPVQPITAAPIAARNPEDAQTWVFFGTGKYLSEGDLSDTSVNTWYGVIDSGYTIDGHDNLTRRQIQAEGQVSGMAVRVIEDSEPDDMFEKDGWYLNLVSPVNGAEGERIVVPNRFQGMALIGTSRIPDSNDPCNPSGRGYIMAINPFTGGRLPATFFDVSGDGMFDQQDMLIIDGVPVPVSGIGFSSSPNNPIFVGSVMLATFDDGSTESILTSQAGLGVRRVSWREIVAP